MPDFFFNNPQIELICNLSHFSCASFMKNASWRMLRRCDLSSWLRDWLSLRRPRFLTPFRSSWISAASAWSNLLQTTPFKDFKVIMEEWLNSISWISLVRFCNLYNNGKWGALLQVADAFHYSSPILRSCYDQQYCCLVVL